MAKRVSGLPGSLALVVFLAACGDGGGTTTTSTTLADSTTSGPTTSTSASLTTTPQAEVSGGEEVLVSGEMLAWPTDESGETCAYVGAAQRCEGGLWESDYIMSDPRLTGYATSVFNVDSSPDFFRWWLTSVITADAGTWEGLNTGEILPSGVHQGVGVYLGTGAYEGLRYDERMYMAPGVDTREGDPFEVSGRVGDVAAGDWALDPTQPAGPTSDAVDTAIRVWSSGDHDGALALYAEDATFLDVDGSLTEGNADIATRVAAAADAGLILELLPPLFVRGNFAAGAFHWTDDTDQGWLLAIFQLDAETGRIVHQEMIGA